MNTTTRRKGSRLVAGLVAAGIGVAAALGVATPAMAAPDSSNINPAATGSIVVHKFEQPTTQGARSTGSALPSAQTSTLTPVSGVTFSVRRVTHATALDLTKSSTWQTLSALTPAQVTAAGSGYSLGTAATQVTAADGTATFGSLPVGVYLVEETAVGAQPVALRAQPFLVSIPLPENGAWVYDVHVYPKNALTGITLAQDTTAARALGDTVKYTVTTNVPNKQTGNPISSYVITDTLDVTQVTYASSVVRLGSTVLSAPGTATPDYTLTTDAATGLVTVTLTTAGIAKVNAAPNGSQVILEVNATVTALGDGSIENNATVNINSTTTVRATQVVSSWGAARIIKYPSTNENLRLQGAVFEVRLPGSATAIPVGTGTPRQTQFTTGENGEVVIPGLIAGSYELVEITAPTGYQVNATPIAFTVTAGSTANAVQVKVANTQVPAFALPITGGDGQMAFMIGGGSLLVVAAGAFLIVAGRRRVEQQA